MFTMYDYLEDILVEAPMDFDDENITPAISKLFQVNETHQKLDMVTVDLFHCIVTRFLYVAKRARSDLQVVVVFLCKQVKCPNTGDWKKLGRLVCYVRDTIHLPLIIGLDGSGNIVWSINASFAVHMDMKSHTRYCLTLGTGSPISESFGQKVNSRSWTELELIGVNDATGFVEWASFYCKDQMEEYPTKHPFKDLNKKNVVMQDNTSTIKMVKGGRRVYGARI